MHIHTLLLSLCTHFLSNTPTPFLELHLPIPFLELHLPISFLELHSIPIQFFELHIAIPFLKLSRYLTNLSLSFSLSMFTILFPSIDLPGPARCCRHNKKRGSSRLTSSHFSPLRNGQVASLLVPPSFPTRANEREKRVARNSVTR